MDSYDMEDLNIKDVFNLLAAYIEADGYEIGRKADPHRGDGWYLPTVFKKPKAKREKKEVEYTSSFNIFWIAYPRKEGKPAAARAFMALSMNESIKALDDCRKRYDGVDKQFIPHAASYLNGKRFNDDPLPKPSVKKKLPRDSELETYAIRNGLPTPNIGELFPAYRKRLEGLME